MAFSLQPEQAWDSGVLHPNPKPALTLWGLTPEHLGVQFPSAHQSYNSFVISAFLL